MTPELEKLLGVDFSVCRQLLIGAGLTSLGKNLGLGKGGGYSWKMTPELEKLLGVDFSVCRQLLIGAGLTSLGKLLIGAGLTSLGKNLGLGERGRV